MTTVTMCILGASGDLTRRLLLPGLGTLLARDPHRRVRIVGCDRTATSDAQWQDKVVHAFTSAGVTDGPALAEARQARWFTADVTSADDMSRVLRELADSDPLVLYFALPPAVSQRAVQTLCTTGVPDGTQLAFEKPFGGNLSGAVELNRTLLQLVPETSIHRVDHFLGRSTVLNLLSLRFANRLFEPVWNAENVLRVEIVFDEKLTLEGRAGYYDHAGAMVDMLQSHLLQVMAFAMMEPPARVDEVDLRDATTAVLRAARPWGNDPAAASHRARYSAGTIGGRQVPNYVDEDGVDPANDTETLAQISVEIANQRWAGVPVTLRSGKSIGSARKQIIITFATVRHVPQGLRGQDEPDQLLIDLDPDRIELRLTTNASDDALRLRQSVLSADLGTPQLRPYGEVLAGILDGDPTLTVRGDAAQECWRLIESFQQAWRDGEVPMQEYDAGSHGPTGWDPPTR
ncbi:MAG: glucose-6-phosphate dehydrogenase [Actinomycetales bacterium]